MMDAGALWRPRLKPKARLKFDAIERRELLLFPEAALALNETAAAVLALCDGERPLAMIISDIKARFSTREPEKIELEVREFLEQVRARGLLE